MSYSNWPTARPAPQSRSRSRSASNASAASAMSPSRKRAPASVAERATRSDSTDTGCGGAPAAPLAAVRPAKVSCSAQRIVSSPSDAITASRKSRTCQSACTTTLRKQLNSPRGLRIPAAPPLPRSCSRITLASETGCGRAALGFGSSDASAPGAPPQPFALGRLDDIVKGSTAPARPSAVCQRCCCKSTYKPHWLLTSAINCSAWSRCPARTRVTMCSTTTWTLSSGSCVAGGASAAAAAPPLPLSSENGSTEPERPSADAQRRCCRSIRSPCSAACSMRSPACCRWFARTRVATCSTIFFTFSSVRAACAAAPLSLATPLASPELPLVSAPWESVKGSIAPARPSAVCQRCCCSSTYRPSCLTSPVSASASPISPCRTRATMCSTTVRTCPSSTRGFGFTTVTSSSRAKDTSACVETFVSDVISSSRIVSSNSCRSKSTACCRSSSALKGVKSASPPLLPASALTGCEVGKNAAYRSTAAVPSLSALQTTRAHACAPCSSSCANRSMRGPGSAAAGGAAPSAASSPAALALVSV
mmetsp:Transcript_38177/g.117278  ORF Transcript_38177/g.117278 Transcript_38177/m.117278 type:complete len:536 (-) Transcript_38177:723-2330(-)